MAMTFTRVIIDTLWPHLEPWAFHSTEQQWPTRTSSLQHLAIDDFAVCVRGCERPNVISM